MEKRPRKPRAKKPPFVFPVMTDSERFAETERMMALHPHLVFNGVIWANETRLNDARRGYEAALVAADRSARKAVS
ncbi:MAG: hypothetical protein ACYDD1_06860 [Caulobacteraceae bacterium]